MLCVLLQWVIIPLFSSAVAQFRKYKSPRMKRYLSKYFQKYLIVISDQDVLHKKVERIKCKGLTPTNAKVDE